MSHDVNDYLAQVINHLLYGIPANFVKLFKCAYNDYDECKIAALRLIKKLTEENQKDFSFELTGNDCFLRNSLSHYLRINSHTYNQSDIDRYKNRHIWTQTGTKTHS